MAASLKIVLFSSLLAIISALPYEGENRIATTGFALNTDLLGVIANVTILQQQVKGN